MSLVLLWETTRPWLEVWAICVHSVTGIRRRWPRCVMWSWQPAEVTHVWRMFRCVGAEMWWFWYMRSGKVIKCLWSISFLLLPFKVFSVRGGLLVFELCLVPLHLSYWKVSFQLLITSSSRLFVIFLPWNESTVLFKNSIWSLNVIVSLVGREGKRF